MFYDDFWSLLGFVNYIWLIDVRSSGRVRGKYVFDVLLGSCDSVEENVNRFWDVQELKDYVFCIL